MSSFEANESFDISDPTTFLKRLVTWSDFRAKARSAKVDFLLRLKKFTHKEIARVTNMSLRQVYHRGKYATVVQMSPGRPRKITIDIENKLIIEVARQQSQGTSMKGSEAHEFVCFSY